MRPGQREVRQSGFLYELSAVVLNLIRSPPTPISLSGEDSLIAPSAAGPSLSRRHPPPLPQITPAGFAWLLLGVSLAMMLCGSIAFFIGFMLMPWVFGLAMVLYLAGIVSALSFLGRYILGSDAAPPGSRKKIPSRKIL